MDGTGQQIVSKIRELTNLLSLYRQVARYSVTNLNNSSLFGNSHRFLINLNSMLHRKPYVNIVTLFGITQLMMTAL